MKYKDFLFFLKKEKIQIKDFSYQSGITTSTIYNTWKTKGVPKWVDFILENKDFLNIISNKILDLKLYKNNIFNEKIYQKFKVDCFRSSQILILNDNKNKFANNLFSAIENGNPFIYFTEDNVDIEYYLKSREPESDLHILNLQNQNISTARLEKNYKSNRKYIYDIFSNRENLIIILPSSILEKRRFEEYYKSIIKEIIKSVADNLGSYLSNPNEEEIFEMEKKKEKMIDPYYIFLNNYPINLVDNMDIFLAQSRASNIIVVLSLQSEDIDKENIIHKRIIANVSKRFIFSNKSNSILPIDLIHIKKEELENLKEGEVIFSDSQLFSKNFFLKYKFDF